jgi:hypothetical protein
VDALLSPNVDGWHVPLLREQLRERFLAEPTAEILTRVVESTDRATSSSRGPPGEQLWRWNGPERDAILATAERAAAALKRLDPDPGWTTPERLLRQVEELLGGDARQDTLESELDDGSAIFEVLVSCAAVAAELEHVLGLRGQADKAA